MAKKSLNKITFEEAVALVKKYHKNKEKQAYNAPGMQDPYLTVDDIKRKFNVAPELAQKIFMFLFEDPNYKRPMDAYTPAVPSFEQDVIQKFNESRVKI
jgi:hypothetical protein